MNPTEKKIDLRVDAIPQAVYDCLANPLFKAMKKYYEDPVNLAKYEAWLIEYKKRPKIK